MAAEPKAFQRATIDAALATLMDRNGARRFLVADEVGLGKTVVARGVIEIMAAHRRRPLSVLYVCSNLTIAAQNLSRLVGFLNQDERKRAVCKVDRPSLLVTQDRPSHERIHIYSLTPDTAVPSRSGHGAGGRKEERALAYLMLSHVLPGLSRLRLRRALRGGVGTASFREVINRYRKGMSLGGVAYRQQFADALREVLGLEAGQHLPPRLEPLLAQPRELARSARAALALASLNSIEPDLVIFDEFQRFSDLVRDSDEEDSETVDDLEGRLRDRAANRVLDAIRGQPSGNGPALLLLSATPYEPFRGRREKAGNPEAATHAHAEDFFQLIKFLAGERGQRVADDARKCFTELSEEMRKGVLDSARAQKLRAQLQKLLFPLMSRTERPQSSSPLSGVDPTIEAELLPADMMEFRRLHACFGDFEAWVLPLWQSVPLPMQTLGHRYLAWKHSRPERSPAAPALSKRDRTEYRKPDPWPHPRLRALLRAMPQRQLALPWIAPSVPWWPLAGDWKERHPGDVDGKLLVFSRFRAVPTALAGLISYSLETALVEKQPRLKNQIPNRQWLQPNATRAALLELFYPSPFLANLEPLHAAPGSPRRVVAAFVRQLRSRLAELGVTVGKGRSNRPAWKLMAALDQQAGYWARSAPGWRAVLRSTRNRSDPDSGNRLEALIAEWNKVAAEPVDEISSTELNALAQLALDSPGIVLFRALVRHWAQEKALDHFDIVLGLVWRGLRACLDSPWFAATLESSEERDYPAAIRRAVIDGNLEAVLDEHFWYLAKEGSDTWPERLAQLETSLKLRDASVTLHQRGPAPPGQDEDAFRLGCHVAVPLTEAKVKSAPEARAQAGPDEEQDLRPDLVRRAFNSPFWPNVLITTSVGQEGLDFHPWCQALAHWDLANGPIALEQREGRITRFAGLSVRRVVAERLKRRLEGAPMRASPWSLLEEWADRELCDEPGLAPWWYLPANGSHPGSSCHHLFFALPGSELRERHAELAHERALYRLVLGMPDQADLLSHLSSHATALDAEAIRNACLNLCAFDRVNRRVARPPARP